MTKELVISANRHETKVAVLEDDQLVEIYYQRSEEYSLAGSVHKGRVTRVLPGMQSAFVDLGLERDTFLYVSDFFEESDEYEKLPDDRPSRRRPEQDRVLPPPRTALPESRPEAAVVESASSIAGPSPVDAAAARPADQRSPRHDDRRHRDDRRREDRPPRTDDRPPRSAEQPSRTADQLPPHADDRQTRPPSDDRNARGGDRRDRGPDRAGERPGDRAGDRGGDRGRGGRGRRRRGRGGRGLPESKYAENRPTEENERIVPAAEASLAPAPIESSLELLPGESLRKYARVGGEELESFGPPEPEPVEFPGDSEGDFDDEPDVEGDPDSEESEGTEGPGAAETGVELETKTAGIKAEAEPLAVPALHSPAVSEPGEVAAVPPAESPVDILNERSSGLTEVQLDHIQEAAEKLALGGGAGVPSAPPKVEALAGAGEPESESESEVEEEAEADGEETAEEDELGIDNSEEGSEEPALDENGDPIPQTTLEGEPGPAPPLASMDSMASSHREQTSRYMRGRRMRRRRSGPGGDVRTVPREGAEAREPREPREAREPREPREARGDGRDREGRVPREARETKERNQPASITELLKEGQEIVVQIAKEPMGTKGARITSHIALPGRYCVYMPTVEHLGVSRKISTDEERQRLRRILQKCREGIAGGFIIRTAGEGKTEEQIAADIQYLSNLWLEMKEKADKCRAPALLYHDVEVVQRLLRDQLTDNFKAIWVDNEDLYEAAIRFVGRMQPQMVNRVKLYTRSVPIFDAFNITTELEKALRPKVWLKTGGYIVINQTEALVAIDVNTGKFVGRSNRLEDTIVKTNTDAVKEIVRQIRLRDLGGIIVVDFIDMDERRNRQKVMQALEEAMRADRAPNKILQFNDFGLVAITRKRVKQSLERTLCSPCPTCEGSGYTKSVQTVISEILGESLKLANVVEGKEIVLRVHPAVAVALKSRENNYLEELEETFRKPVLVKSDDTMHPEKFDMA